MSYAVLIIFSTKTKKFDSAYERNQFYRGLYGWKQVIVKNYGRYEYKKTGIINNVPHLKVDKSAFIIAKEGLDDIKDYFEEWEDKIRFNFFEIKINKDEAKKLKVDELW